MFKPDFINKVTKRTNSYKSAKKNGLFDHPENFEFPEGIGLDLLGKRAVLKKTLVKKLKAGDISASQIYFPGNIVLPVSNKIVPSNPANRAKAEQEAAQLVRETRAEPLSAEHVSIAVKNIATFSGEVATEKMFEPVANNFRDIVAFRDAVRPVVKKEIYAYFRQHKSFKVIFKLGVHMKRNDNEGAKQFVFSSSGYYQTKERTVDTATPITNIGDIRNKFNNIFDDITRRITEHEGRGSGWSLVSVDFLKVKMVKYAPFRGASYIDLPQWLKNKQVCINVQNTDNECFKYAILSALHNKEVHTANRPNAYSKWLTSLNFDGIEFPVPADASVYQKFEEQNNIPINVFVLNEPTEDDASYYDVLYINRLTGSSMMPINLLLVNSEDETSWHYVWIKSLSGFIRDSKVNLHCCSRCLQRFKHKSAYDRHLTSNKCEEFKSEATKTLPNDGEHYCEFNNTKKQLMVPFVLYADCESLLLKAEAKKGKSTDVYQTHKGNHLGVKLVSQYPELLSDVYRQFDGEDYMDKFLQYCIEIQDKALAILKTNKPMQLTSAEKKAFAQAVDCNLCKKPLGSDRVRDHDHLTGKYRGACHNKCNIEYNYKHFKLPVIFHNLRGYDSHLILQHAGKLQKKVTCIPNTMEKYLSFTIDKCVFLDSLQFTLSSLEALVQNLNKANGTFKYFNAEFQHANDELKTLLRQKGVFPYDWFDSTTKLTETSLPPKEAFYSKLNDEPIDDKDYELAQTVWNKAGCTTFYDYLSLYLKTDVLLLADVFETFRSVTMKYYGLDACHYYTAPGFSWDAMMKMTGVRIEAFKDGQLDMLQMVQRGMRGGISMISKRYAKANNKYMSTYDPAVESSYITYLDANNLYGWAMSQFLPIGNYKWDEDTAKYTPEYIATLGDEATTGCILEVDVDVPAELHDKFNDYPLAPETTTFEPSPTMQKLRDQLDISKVQVDKLIPNLHNKQKYVLHYRNLKLYLSLGMQLKQVHRVLTFDQAPYLKTYIDFNTQMRAKATNDFEKDFFKLLNNAIFGKTCENVEKRIEVKLFTDPKKFVNMASRPYFKNFEIFTNELVACEMRKTQVKYNRPMIVGMCILDLSKVLMYDFHYNTIGKQYGSNAQLCFTDTDSLTYHIKTEDYYADMKQHLDLYDTSDYPKEHPCYSAANKKIIGKFKDETNSKPIYEFCGLRAKMYSILKDEEHSKATAKGIKKNVIKRLTHNEFKAAIFGTTTEELQQKATFNLIRSTGHQLNSIKITKTGLCGYDDKRYILDDNVHTLAHGHYKTLQQ